MSTLIAKVRDCRLSHVNEQELRAAAQKEEVEWLLATYRGEAGCAAVVVGFHRDELAELLENAYPYKTVLREPITAYTGVEPVDYWFHGKRPVEPGDTFTEFINQGHRPCTVIAVDKQTHEYLYEYEMPNGTSAIRRHSGVTMSYMTIPKGWLTLIEEQTGIENLIATPQGCTIRIAGKVYGGRTNQRSFGQPLKQWLIAKLRGIKLEGEVA